MPLFATPLPETYLSVTRRVARSAIGSLFKLTTLPKDKTMVSFSGESGQSLVWNSKMKQFFRSNENFNQKLGNYGKLKVDVKEETVEDFNLIMDTFHDRHVPLFNCPYIDGLHVKPVYDKTKLTLSCTWRSENREEADVFRNDLRHHIAEGRAEVPIEIQYYIMLPKSAIGLLKHCYDLQENQAGYGVAFNQWLKEGSFGNIKQITKLNGEGAAFVIEERQIMVYGTFEFTTPPERSKLDQGSAHEVTFDFTIVYDKPIEVACLYPLMIHNQLIHEMFHPQPQYDIGRIPAHRDVFRYVSDKLHWSRTAKPLPNAKSQIVLPEYDSWEAPFKPEEEICLASTIVELDSEDTTQILNIYDFEEVEACTYSTNLKRYFRFCVQFLTNSRESPFFFRLHENDKPVHPDTYRVDTDGNIVSFNPLDLRKTYHLTIGFVKDWRKLSDECIKRLCNMPWMLDEFLQVIHPGYNQVNWLFVNQKMKEMGMESSGDKAIDYLRMQGHVFDKWNDPRWSQFGMKPIARQSGWIKQWTKEFYLEHGRYPSSKEINDFYHNLTPELKTNFFGHADEEELRQRYLYPFQGNQTSLDSWKWRLMHHVGFFTVTAHRQGE